MKNTKLKYKLNFKTMKKGLLTLLAASLVFVGCQNYDDQFDDLNAQISALKSQVDGLSSLSGQVASLSGSISGLQSGIAASASSAQMTALSASLTALQAEVDAIEASIATTATAAEVTALQASLTALETDLADLLTSNNVYATAITVDSAASMASALALGNKVALMNAAVSITDKATIADADIQTFVDRIKTMNGTFTYDSDSATGFVPTFDEMVAATVINITPAGPVSFKKLASATDVTITTSYATKITSLDMSALTSVSSFNTGTANQLHLSSATNVDLGELTRYGASLSIQTKKDATLDIAKLDDKTAAGVQSDIALTLNGPQSVTLSLIDDGTITLQNVETATVSGFYGTLDIKGGVETLTTTDSVFIDLDSASDLVTATLDFKADWDPLLTTANAAIAAAGYSTTYLEDYTSGQIVAPDLKTLSVTGDLLDLHLDEANLESLTVNANMTDLTMATLTDLTSLSVSGNVGSISLTSSPNIAVADFNHTTNLENKGSATANKSVSFVVTDNLGLTKLHTTGDLVHTFTVTGNDALTELDMTGLKTRGTETTGGTVNLWDNDLTAVKSTDTTDAETATATTGADGGSADVGTTDDGTSGMDTMKIYLTAIAADAKNTAQVNFDTVSTFDDSETSTTTTTLNVLGSTALSATTNDATVLKMTPAAASNAVADIPATTEQRAWYVNSTANGNFQLTINGVGVPATALALTGNAAVDAGNIASAANVTLASNAGVVLNAKVGGFSEGIVTLIAHANNATTAVGERYATTAALTAASTDTGVGDSTVWAVGAEDEFTFTVGSNSVTASTGGQSVSGTAIADIEEAIVKAWAAKYGSAGTASLSAIATMADDGDGKIEWTMLQTDSGGYDQAISFSVADKSANPTGTDTSSRTANNIGWVIGATRSTGDNGTTASATKGLIVTVASKNSGTLDNAIVSGVTTNVGLSSSSMVEYTTVYRANTTGNGLGAYANVGANRTDIVVAEDLVAGSANTAAAATKFNRVTWLG